MPRRSRVATLADCKVIAPKRALAIVARHAALPAAGRVMIERFGRGDLSSLRHSGSDLVAFGAGNFLVLRVVKADAERLGKFRRPGITTQLMTRAAGGNIPPARLRARRMTSKTSCVRVESSGYREGNAGARRPVTRGATDAAHVQVSRVIELHAETLQTWKRLQRSRFHVRMTDRTDGTCGICELLSMTSGAGKMTGPARAFRARRIVLAPMT